MNERTKRHAIVLNAVSALSDDSGNRTSNKAPPLNSSTSILVSKSGNYKFCVNCKTIARLRWWWWRGCCRCRRRCRRRCCTQLFIADFMLRKFRSETKNMQDNDLTVSFQHVENRYKLTDLVQRVNRVTCSGARLVYRWGKWQRFKDCITIHRKKPHFQSNWTKCMAEVTDEQIKSAKCLIRFRIHRIQYQSRTHTIYVLTFQFDFKLAWTAKHIHNFHIPSITIPVWLVMSCWWNLMIVTETLHVAKSRAIPSEEHCSNELIFKHKDNRR